MCSGIMQRQISLCGVYFESLFDYMEQRSSKERASRGPPPSPCTPSTGLSFSRGKGIGKGREWTGRDGTGGGICRLICFSVHTPRLQSRLYSFHGRYRLVTDLFSPGRSSDGGKNMVAVLRTPTPCPPRPSASCAPSVRRRPTSHASI